MTARKTYSKEFRLDAVALVVKQKYSRAEAAKNLGLRAETSDTLSLAERGRR